MKTCGNCNAIRFTGAHELAQDAGPCARHRESGRTYVLATQEACPLWSKRTNARKKRDQARRAELEALVNAANHAAQKRRR